MCKPLLLRALKSGASMGKVRSEMVKKFRKADNTTPIILMGYFNPIHAYGAARFTHDVSGGRCADGLDRGGPAARGR